MVIFDHEKSGNSDLRFFVGTLIVNNLCHSPGGAYKHQPHADPAGARLRRAHRHPDRTQHLLVRHRLQQRVPRPQVSQIHCFTTSGHSNTFTLFFKDFFWQWILELENWSNDNSYSF